MSVVTPPLAIPSLPPPYPMRKFTVDEYHRMIQAGILTENDPVELLEGWIVLKMVRNPPHDGTIQVANQLLMGLSSPAWQVRIQSAITTDDSEPEPDLAVVPGPATRFFHHHPGPQEIGVVIEVADSTLAHDRRDKGRTYARAGIVCYWIINLVDRQVEVYTDPSGPDPNPAYRRRQDYGLQDSLPLVLAGQGIGQIPVQELFPTP